MRYLLFLLILVAVQPSLAQTDWQWTELAPMPAKIANNAVVAVNLDSTDYVYSFGGIDTTKLNTGIVQTAMRYDVQANSWETIAPLPDTLGKIASAASMVDGMIYIIGGYHVFDDMPFELSSDRVHRYDPVSNTYLTDGAPVPVPIDDQVQVVWRDSLIYVITGWSDVANVADVQIYNPAFDQWALGTSVPPSAVYTAFGASGSIVGDTIYYYSGASGGSFGATARLRKGVIDVNDPSQIEWEFVENGPAEPAYRSASMSVGNKVFWLGGSAVSYNFDGIAYNGSGGVDPLHRVLEYDASTFTWTEGLGQEFGIMDLRGIGQLTDSLFIIAGGMEADQLVTNRVFSISYMPQPLSLSEPHEQPFISLWPSVFTSDDMIKISLHPAQSTEVQVFNEQGAIVHQGRMSGSKSINPKQWNMKKAGLYLLRFMQDDKVYTTRLVLLA